MAGISTPIGLHEVMQFITESCEKASFFQFSGMKPKHLLLALDPGEGRTTLIDYLTEQFKRNHVLNFTCGLDDYLEIVLDGTPRQLQQSFDLIEASHIYKNHYENVVALDISAIANHINQIQLSDFIQKVSHVCKHAYVVFFISSQRSRKEEQLVQKLKEAVPNINEVTVEPYTTEELVEMMVYDMASHSVVIEDLEAFRVSVKSLIEVGEIRNARNAIMLSRELMVHADQSSYYAVLFLSKHAVESFVECQIRKGV